MMKMKNIKFIYIVVVLFLLTGAAKSNEERTNIDTNGSVPILYLFGQEEVIMKSDKMKDNMKIRGYLHIAEDGVLLYFSPYDYIYDNRENAVLVDRTAMTVALKEKEIENERIYGKKVIKEDMEGTHVCVSGVITSIVKEDIGGCIAKIGKVLDCYWYQPKRIEKETREIQYPPTPLSNPASYWKNSRPLSIYRYTSRPWQYINQRVELVGLLCIGEDVDHCIFVELGWPFAKAYRIKHHLSSVIRLNVAEIPNKGTIGKERSMDGTVVIGYREQDEKKGTAYQEIYNNDYIEKMVRISVESEGNKYSSIAGIGLDYIEVFNPVVELYEIRRTKP